MNTIELIEVSSPGCHNCASFKEFWEAEQANWPNVNFKDVSITEEEGQKLISEHQIMASPGIIINGELFATGGINQDDFKAKLKELSGE